MNVLNNHIKGSVGHIQLNRPDRANALSAELLAGLDSALAQFEADDDVKVVIISGAGDGFCGGYDIQPGGLLEASKSNPVLDWRRLHANAQRWLRLWRFPKPVIAQVHGYCLAGGLELVSACDFVVAADDSRFGYPAVRGVGVPPLMLFTLMMHPHALRRLLYTGDSLYGNDAVGAGLATEAVPLARLQKSVDDLAERIALMPLEQLLLAKASLVRTYDAMGVGQAALGGVEFDVISHFSGPVQNFWEVARRDGVRSAVRQRDQPFGD